MTSKTIIKDLLDNYITIDDNFGYTELHSVTKEDLIRLQEEFNMLETFKRLSNDDYLETIFNIYLELKTKIDNKLIKREAE